MNPPDVTIFTCSYNKPRYVADAINSVLNQTFANFEYVILENSNDKVTRKMVHGITDKRVNIIDVDFSDTERDRIYVESRLKNNYYPQARGQFIMYLADDDILEPTCFAEHIQEFAQHPDYQANYHGYKITYLDSHKPDDIKPAIKTFGPHRSPKERMDGGSLMFKKDLLEAIPDPYFKCNWHDAHISDSLFLHKLSTVAVFQPINQILHTKRVTKISTHTFIDEAGVPRFFRPQYGWEHLHYS